MTVTFAYRTQNNNIVLSMVHKDEWELVSFDLLISFLSKNPGLLDRPFLCEDGLISSIYGGTAQYAGNIKKHAKPLWLATKDFRGTIDFYYSQFEWPFQIQLHPCEW
jgi:hypothetical protein